MTVAITTRAGKGSSLTYPEVDANFTNLKSQAEENDHKHVTVTAAYSAIVDSKVILADATAAAFQIDLPLVADAENMIFFIKKIDVSANAVTIAAQGIELIDGLGTATLAAQYDVIRLYSDGVSWHIL